MRDILLLAIVLSGCVAALKRPWIGVMLWTWLSIMNPHRYAYGFAYDAPLAAMAVGSTAIGLLMTRDRASPFKGSPVAWFAVFMFWITLSWLFGLAPERDYDQWKKVMKIDVMLLVGLMLLHTRQHIMALMCVCVGSLALLGAKGGIFTILTGGSYRVWGPPGSFIEDNNEFALALVMTIPLLRFFQLQLKSIIGRYLMIGLMVACAASALGSHSRGALIAIVAMTSLLWLRGSGKLQTAVLIVAVAIPLVAFMPAEWTSRMSSIDNYEQDSSAMGRINAWWVAWHIAANYPFGAGFNPATPTLFGRFAPNPRDIHAAHSIYFQILGNHGFVGLALYLGLWFSTWRAAGWLRLQRNLPPEARWAADLGAMCQVAMAGYLVGGTFLSLAYFDLPYNIMAAVVLTRAWVEKQSWKTEHAVLPRWMTRLGLSMAKKAS